MIDQLLPLSKKKLEILKFVYEKDSTHLREISSQLKIHPYQTKIIIDSLIAVKILEQKNAGKTILLSLNKLSGSVEQLIYIVEDYKQKTENKILNLIIKNLKQQFSRNNGILSCCIFGSYTRNAQTKESDIDVLFVVKNKNAKHEISKKISQLRVLLNLNFSPIILDEKEFVITLQTKEPATVTLLKPSQRIILLGIEYFIKTTGSVN